MEALSAFLALCEGNPPITGKFPPQRSVTRSFDDWVNDRDAGDLRSHRAHYDVTVMCIAGPWYSRNHRHWIQKWLINIKLIMDIQLNITLFIYPSISWVSVKSRCWAYTPNLIGNGHAKFIDPYKRKNSSTVAYMISISILVYHLYQQYLLWGTGIIFFIKSE